MKYDGPFNVGDLVQLRSGGPAMSVELLVGNLLLCTWFDPAGRTRRGTFSARELCVAPATAPVWVGVLRRLSGRWPVVAANC